MPTFLFVSSWLVKGRICFYTIVTFFYRIVSPLLVGFINTTMVSVMSVREIIVRKMRKNSFRECLSALVNRLSSGLCACRYFVWQNTSGCFRYPVNPLMTVTGNIKRQSGVCFELDVPFMLSLCSPIYPHRKSTFAGVPNECFSTRGHNERDDLVCDKWVPVTTAWRVLRFQVEERLPIWRVDANILNKQSWIADKGWSSSLGVGRGANNSSP